MNRLVYSYYFVFKVHYIIAIGVDSYNDILFPYISQYLNKKKIVFANEHCKKQSFSSYLSKIIIIDQ